MAGHTMAGHTISGHTMDIEVSSFARGCYVNEAFLDQQNSGCVVL